MHVEQVALFKKYLRRVHKVHFLCRFWEWYMLWSCSFLIKPCIRMYMNLNNSVHDHYRYVLLDRYTTDYICRVYKSHIICSFFIFYSYRYSSIHTSTVSCSIYLLWNRCLILGLWHGSFPLYMIIYNGCVLSFQSSNE